VLHFALHNLHTSDAEQMLRHKSKTDSGQNKAPGGAHQLEQRITRHTRTRKSRATKGKATAGNRGGKRLEIKAPD
jgi:hypothetical protein